MQTIHKRFDSKIMTQHIDQLSSYIANWYLQYQKLEYSILPLGITTPGSISAAQSNKLTVAISSSSIHFL